MNNGKILNYKVNNKSNNSSITSQRKRGISPIMSPDKFINNNIYSQYPNYINPINYINNQAPNSQYPNYFTNFNTSNNYHINASQQNFYYEKNNPRYNRYIYPEDNNNIQNNYFRNYLNKTVNRRLIKEAKENIRNISYENKKKKKSNNNYVNLDIINCETQYPIMTCLNADPYNKLKRKSFIHNYNNINNYIIYSNSKNSNETFKTTNEEKLNSIYSESLFNNKLKNNNKYNNSCYNFRNKRNIKNIETIKNNLKKYNDIAYANALNKLNNNKKSKLKEVILNTDYNYKGILPKTNDNLNLNNKNKDYSEEKKFKKAREEKQNLENKMKKFINLIEQYFINSFHKLFNNFLSQMVVFIKEKIYENKNLLLKRFQRAKNNRIVENKSVEYTPDKVRKLISGYNKVNNKIYIPKKQHKYIKPIKKKVYNIKTKTSNNNSNTNSIRSINTENTFKMKEKPFQKRIIHKNNNSFDKLRDKANNFYYNSKNRSQDNLFIRKELSPSNPSFVKTKFILRKNLNNISNKKRFIYTKKKTNKFNINKKYIKDEYFYNNMIINNNNIDSKNKLFSFINLYGTRSPINNKIKANERYDDIYNEKENDNNEDIIEEIIIKDICTYDNKFSVFIKYVTSQRYELNYLKLKLLKHQNLYLNHKLEYIGITHTDSIILPAVYGNTNLIMNEIIEEKESFYFSNIQDDENDVNKLLNMINIIEYFCKQQLLYLYNHFFNSLKYIINYSNNSDSKGRNNRKEKISKSKTYCILSDKTFLIDNNIDIKKKLVNIDLINDIFKRSNSVKFKKRENNMINYFEPNEKRPKF